MDLLAVNEANIQAVVAYPPLVIRVIAPDDHVAFADAHNATTELTSSSFGKLMGRKPIPADEVRLPVPDDSCIYLDLDMAWPGMHYLFTCTLSGGDPPLNFLLCDGGSARIENTFGMARVFSATQVKRIEEALAQLTDGELRDRYSPGDMFVKHQTPKLETEELDRDLMEAEQPPDASAEEVEDKYSLDYMMKYVGLLRAFLRQAVEQRRGMIVY
jgi:hypothetical protein